MSAVEPRTSQNRIVTYFRAPSLSADNPSAKGTGAVVAVVVDGFGDGVAAVRECLHWLQNLADGRTGALQAGQLLRTGSPQASQKRDPSAFSVPQ